MAVDADVLERIRERLRVSTRVAPDDEVLVGSTDMLAGPDAVPTADMAEALDENEPWEPPDVPQLAPTRVEERGGVSPADRQALAGWEEGGGEPDDLLDEEDRADREGQSAPT